MEEYSNSVDMLNSRMKGMEEKKQRTKRIIEITYPI